jgi:hypothetical protein
VRARGWLLAGALLLVAACSAVQFGYSQLDRIVYWYVDDYLPLSAEQGAALKPRIARLVQWHCTTQLPAYTAWLRAVQADLLAGAGPERLDRHVDQAIGFLREIGKALAPEAAALLAQASPQQIAALFEAMDRRSREYREDWVDAAPQEIARRRDKRMRARIEGWIGPLNPPQEQALERWSRSQAPTGASFLDSRHRWQAALRQALERRGNGAAFGEDIRTLFARPETIWNPDYLRAAQANRARTLELLAALAAALDDSQRRHLELEVATTAGDLEKLACTGGAPRLGAVPAAFAGR